MSTMHGDEPATRRILAALRDGRPVRGIDLWLIPVVNPDGLARRHAEQRARRRPEPQLPLPLARPRRATTSPARAPASEPETRALMRVLRRGPARAGSSASTSRCTGSTSRRRASPAVRAPAGASPAPARASASPAAASATAPSRSGTCPARRASRSPSEYGGHPGRHRMTVTAPRQLLRVLGAPPLERPLHPGLSGPSRSGVVAGSSQRTTQRMSSSGPATQPAV